MIVGGIPVAYVSAPLESEYAGRATRFPTYCRIIIANRYDISSPSQIARYVAHEYAHCYDYFKLGKSHNVFKNEGCIFGNYFCDPAEGYAQTYQVAFTLKCGTDLSYFKVPYIVNFQGGCLPPDPASITPETISAF